MVLLLWLNCCEAVISSRTKPIELVSGLVKVDDGSTTSSDKVTFSNKHKRLIHYATEEVDENKVEFPPGDQLGAAGLDRGFFSHLKKNWTRVMTSSSTAQLKRSVFSLILISGLEIATHWSPMRPKIEHWQLNFQNWSPAGDSRFVR